jgi:hypothetical protein
MSYFMPKPVGDFLTGSETRNCMPWRARHEVTLTRTEWSDPHPLILTANTPEELTAKVGLVCADADLLVLGIGEAHLARGDQQYTSSDVWHMTLIAQVALKRPDAK